LFNKTRSANIKIIYQCVKTSSSILKAITSKKKEQLISSFGEDKALNRRIRHVELTKPMFNTNNYSTNVFINVSVNNLIEEEIKS
jgi:hypothetical protein